MRVPKEAKVCIRSLSPLLLTLLIESHALCLSAPRFPVLSAHLAFLGRGTWGLSSSLVRVPKRAGEDCLWRVLGGDH